MNKFTKYMNSLASTVFGMTMVMLFIKDVGFEEVKWILAASLLVIWIFPLLRVGYLSDELKKIKAEKLTEE